MSKDDRIPRRPPDPNALLLRPMDAEVLLGVRRTRCYHLLKQFERVPWSTKSSPLYRREDVLTLVRPQGRQTEPAAESVVGSQPTNPAPQPERMLTDEEALAAWNEPAKPFEWPKGSDEAPDWVQEALGTKS